MALVLKKPHYAYTKVEKEDPEEKIHRRAQFLIYKVMEQAESRSKRPSYLRIRIRRLKVKIGKRLTKLRRSMSLTVNAARVVSVLRQVSIQLKTCQRLFGGGAERTLVNNLPTPLFA
ncbi:hypothetical protein PanWU01x14_312950 [Parasponia andersonii]|uniref:Uncharacterized protein n=1 Tax=Parasponia andersonii TaxID=3476 RepID=A0A2P5APD0_PARAD|nr:hypothetical protein PanWU01x14_312950 [Parasponia andersonii]